MKIKTKRIIQSTIIIGVIIVLIGVIYSENLFGGTYSEFSLANSQHSCQYNAEGDISYWVWYDTKLNKQEVGFPFSNNPPVKVSCYKQGGWPSAGCCPDNIQCVADSNDQELYGQCNGFAPDYCSDYNDRNKYSNPRAYCEAFNINTAMRSVEDTGRPGICSGSDAVEVSVGEEGICNQYTSNCRCYWDGNDDTGECKSASTIYTFCGDNRYEGNCTQKTVNKIDTCNENGTITYSWEALWRTENLLVPKPTWCEGGVKTFRCNIVRLDFFSFINVMLVILIIMIIYGFSYVRQNKKYKDKYKK